MTLFALVAVLTICSQAEVLLASSKSTWALRDELYKKIYNDDDPHIKDKLPKANLSSNKPLQVHVRFCVSHLHEIAASKQMLDVRLWILMHWKNELMTWNETKYGIKSVYVSTEKIWKPKIAVPESLSDILPKFTEENSNARVMSNGETAFDAAIRMQIQCKMASCFFPKDKHKCRIFLLLVNHDESEVKFVADPTPCSQFVTKGNGLWHLEEEEATVFSHFLEKDWISSVVVKDLILEQRPAYFLATVTCPVTLICMVMVCALLLPSGSSDRMTLLVTCFLAQIVNLDVLFKLLPQTSEYVSYIVTFVLMILVFTVLQLILSCLTAYFEKNRDKFHIAEALLQRLWRYIKQASPKRKKIVNSPVIHVKESGNSQEENNQQENQNEIDEDINKRMPVDQQKEEDALVFRLIHILSAITIVWLAIILPLVCILAYMRKPSFLCNASN